MIPPPRALPWASVSEQSGKLRPQQQRSEPGQRSAQVCPMTGVTIPECSCRRCVDEMIRHHSPLLLDRRFSGGNGRAA